MIVTEHKMSFQEHLIRRAIKLIDINHFSAVHEIIDEAMKKKIKDILYISDIADTEKITERTRSFEVGTLIVISSIKNSCVWGYVKFVMSQVEEELLDRGINCEYSRINSRIRIKENQNDK